MLTPIDYLMAWSVYLLSAGILLLALWRMTRPLWGWLRDLLRIAVVVTLLLPANIDEGGGHLAPAAFIVLFELLSQPDGGLGPLIGVRLLLVALFALVGILLLRLLWFLLVTGGQRARG